jgi:hypothetical protein
MTQSDPIVHNGHCICPWMNRSFPMLILVDFLLLWAKRAHHVASTVFSRGRKRPGEPAPVVCAG